MWRKVSRKEYIAGLRELADFLESRPELPLPDSKTFSVSAYSGQDLDIPKAVANLGFCEKVINKETVGVLRKFRGVNYQVKWYRGAVCKRVFVGYRKITEHYGYQPLAVPNERVEEEYRWECPESLMKACE